MQRHGLQFITNGSGVAETVAQARAAISGGCRWVQVRMKESPVAEVVEALDALIPLCAEQNVTLIVDDHVQLALKDGVNGVHLGQNDMKVREARQILGVEKIIGLTVNSLAHVAVALAERPDYIGLGPWRFTGTKAKLAPVLGADGVREIISRLRAGGFGTPIVVIGGIVADDVADVLACGADGVAVSGAISAADNPASAATQFIEKLEEHNI